MICHCELFSFGCPDRKEGRNGCPGAKRATLATLPANPKYRGGRGGGQGASALLVMKSSLDCGIGDVLISSHHRHPFGTSRQPGRSPSPPMRRRWGSECRCPPCVLPLRNLQEQANPITSGFPGFQPLQHPDGGQNTRLTKRALEITPGIEPLYGSRDENLRLLEGWAQSADRPSVGCNSCNGRRRRSGANGTGIRRLRRAAKDRCDAAEWGASCVVEAGGCRSEVDPEGSGRGGQTRVPRA